MWLQIPKPKAPTRWEQYAKLKGIQNKKKSRMVWDEEAKVRVTPGRIRVENTLLVFAYKCLVLTACQISCVSQEWRPRWGYKRAGDTSKDWAIEVPDTAGACNVLCCCFYEQIIFKSALTCGVRVEITDPMEDQFEKKNKEKRERVAKNELQRLSNIARHSKGKS